MIRDSEINVSLMGAGRAGCAITRLLSLAGYTITTIIDINDEKAEKCASYVGAKKIGSSVSDLDLVYDLLIIGVPDSQISCVAEEIVQRSKARKNSVIVHLSGALSSQILNSCKEAGAFTCSMHPCMTFADEFPDSSLDCYVALEGDKRSVEFLEEIVNDIGGSPFEISQEDKTLYHAGCTIASNYIITLLNFAEEVASSMSGEIPTKSFYHLANRSVENFFKHGAVKSLTGPIARGDVDTVRNHIKALIKENGDLAVVYSILGKRSLKIGQAQGTDPKKINEMQMIFNDIIKEYKV